MRAWLAVSVALVGCTVTRGAQLTEGQVREFLQQTYGADVEQMSIEYDQSSDQWIFIYPEQENCIDCGYRGAVEDSETPRIVGAMMHG
jgi:hypothetical protein